MLKRGSRHSNLTFSKTHSPTTTICIATLRKTLIIMLIDIYVVKKI